MKKLFSNFLLKETGKELVYEEDDNNFLITCTATKFNSYNENGQLWASGSFDKCLRDFYGDNLNVVAGIQHFWNLAVGVFETITTDNDKMTATLRIPKSLKINNDYTIPAIKEGILQGLSTEGWFDDYELTNEGYKIVNGFLAKIDLVSVPAEKEARFKNTKIEIKDDEYKVDDMLRYYI